MSFPPGMAHCNPRTEISFLTEAAGSQTCRWPRLALKSSRTPLEEAGAQVAQATERLLGSPGAQDH